MKNGQRLPVEKLSTETSTILVELGVFGQHEIEAPILAALVTGSPCLLVGAHGSAKTSLSLRTSRKALPRATRLLAARQDAVTEDVAV